MSSIRVTISSNEWNESMINGNGFLCEGEIISRNNITVDLTGSSKNNSLPTFFTSVKIRLNNITRRNFREDGTEEIVKSNVHGNAFVKGWLTIERTQSGRIDTLNPDQLLECLGNMVRVWPDRNLLHPNQEDVIEFWAEKKIFQVGTDFRIGDEVRFKTKGDSIFLDSIVKIDKNTRVMSNFTGEGEETWTNKISKIKDDDSDEKSGEKDWSDED